MLNFCNLGVRGEVFKEYNHSEMLKKAKLNASMKAEEIKAEKHRMTMATTNSINNFHDNNIKEEEEFKGNPVLSMSLTAKQNNFQKKSTNRNPNWREELAEERRIRNECIIEANLHAVQKSNAFSLDDIENKEATRQEGYLDV